jgi:phosphoribosylaminoimidazolecarboxamide formyltransferase/IMP cyclohydrolase
LRLRYGLNPQQTASIEPVVAGRWPFTVRNGRPGYINLLDALNAWQLVGQASRALRRPAATSFKHVSPAGAAVAGPVDAVTAELYDLDPDQVTPPAPTSGPATPTPSRRTGTSSPSRTWSMSS